MPHIIISGKMIDIMRVKNRVSEDGRYTKNFLFVISPSDSLYLYFSNVFFIRIKTKVFLYVEIFNIFLLVRN